MAAQQANRDASADFRFLDDRAAFAGPPHAAGGIVGIGADDDVIVMHFDQRSDKWPVAQATSDPVTDRIANLEALFVEIEFERAVFSHTLHDLSPFACLAAI